MRKFTNGKALKLGPQKTGKKVAPGGAQHTLGCVDQRRKVVQALLKLRAPHFGGYDLFKAEHAGDIRERAGKIDGDKLVAYNKAAGELWRSEDKHAWEKKARSQIDIHQYVHDYEGCEGVSWELLRNQAEFDDNMQMALSDLCKVGHLGPTAMLVLASWRDKKDICQSVL